MSYTHLSQAERYQIYALLKAGHAQHEIAKQLGRSRSTISRELTRNTGERGYRPAQAQRLATGRQGQNALRINPTIWRLVEQDLNFQFSPEQIAARLPVSSESIYLYIYANKAQGGVLWTNLRSQKSRRKRGLAGRERRGRIVNRRPISTRPACVATRKQVGHWEGDTVIGAQHQQAIVTLVERKSGFALLAKVRQKKANLVADSIIALLTPVAQKVQTLTFDNGLEFAQHARIDDALQATSYFADPYCSWQRGSNENFNGLLRQYIPKNRPLATLTDEELKMIQDRLNYRPRKRLGFKTPHEVFYNALNRVALRT